MQMSKETCVCGKWPFFWVEICQKSPRCAKKIKIKKAEKNLYPYANVKRVPGMRQKRPVYAAKKDLDVR